MAGATLAEYRVQFKRKWEKTGEWEYRKVALGLTLIVTAVDPDRRRRRNGEMVYSGWARATWVVLDSDGNVIGKEAESYHCNSTTAKARATVWAKRYAMPNL